MASQVMRITLKAYDHQLVDQSASKIIETVKKTGGKKNEESDFSNKSRNDPDLQ